MPAPQRDTYHHGNLRAALLQAGLDLTRTGGPAALVLRDVTRRVGVSPNAAYRHFADRDALVQGVSEAILADMARLMERADAPGDRKPGDARRALRSVGLGYIGFALSEPGWFQVAFAGTDAAPPAAGRADAVPLRSSSAGSHGSHGSVGSAAAGADRPAGLVARPDLPAPLAMLSSALDDLVTEGLLPADERPGAEWPCWAAVHGFALLVLHGPLRDQPRDDVWSAAERTVDAIIDGVLGSPG